jgi:hypothetical protein
VALPEAIPVRYTEEEAGYVSFRPIVRQTFRLNELLDMILTVTGKDPARIRQILRSGTVVFHFYKYWWEGFEVSEAELAPLLTRFPDADPARLFRAGECSRVLMESGSLPHPSTLLDIDRAGASQKALWRRRSVWDVLLSLAAPEALSYVGYSYEHRGDLYRREIAAEQAAALATEVEKLAPRNLRHDLVAASAKASHLAFICPRGNQNTVRPS